MNATVTDLMESPATTKANVSAITTLQDNDAMVAKKDFTIFPNAKTVIAIQRVLWLGLRAVGQYLLGNFASVRKGWKVAFVINVALCIGISMSTIRKGAKSVTVIYLGYLVVLLFAIQTVESVFVSLLWYRGVVQSALMVLTIYKKKICLVVPVLYESIMVSM